jgi:DNA-directed RNA polymerase specialized sigma24 family protein
MRLHDLNTRLQSDTLKGVAHLLAFATSLTGDGEQANDLVQNGISSQ